MSSTFAHIIEIQGINPVNSPPMVEIGDWSSPADTARKPLASGWGARIGLVVDKLGTRRSVAAFLRISTSALQRYVAETNMPPFDVCATLCAKAIVRMEWLAFNVGPMNTPDSYVIPQRTQPSQSARQPIDDIGSGMLAAAIRITDEVLKKYELRDQLSSEEFADLARLVLNDLARGSADDVALASLDRVLAISRKS